MSDTNIQLTIERIQTLIPNLKESGNSFLWFVHGSDYGQYRDVITTEWKRLVDLKCKPSGSSIHHVYPIVYPIHMKSDQAIDDMERIEQYGIYCIDTQPFVVYVDWKNENRLVLKKVVFKSSDSLEVVEEYKYDVLVSITEVDGISSIESLDPESVRFTIGTSKNEEFIKDNNGDDATSTSILVSPFIQKYGHTEIVIANERGASGSGQLSTDGYSIGYSTEVCLAPEKTARLKLRCNIPLTIPSVPPAITLSVEANSALKMEVLCSTTDPALSGAPKAILKIKPNRRNEVRFEAGRVITHNVPDEEERSVFQLEGVQEPKGTSTDSSIEGRLKPFPPIAESNLQGQDQSNLWVFSNHSIGYLVHTNLKEQVLGQVWIAIASKGSEKEEGKDYWYLIGGENEDPFYRGIDLIDLKAFKPGAREYEVPKVKGAVVDVSIDGAIHPLDLYYHVQVTSLIGTKKPMVKVDLMSINGFNGYLDIVSDIAFDFYQDGPIEVNLPPNKRFSFSGK